MINMGVAPFLLASTLELIISQRLVRTICSKCKAPLDVTKEEVLKRGFDPRSLNGRKIFHGTGCDTCKKTGYKGRIGLFEVLPVSTNIRKMIIDGATSDEIEAKAREDGMSTLRDEGIKKILDGLTTLEEISRETQIR
jgi:type IV pilus assembly protein PilB